MPRTCADSETVRARCSRIPSVPSGSAGRPRRACAISFSARATSGSTSTRSSACSAAACSVSVRTMVATARDVVLRDGTTMRLRPPGRDDADRLLAFLTQLSDESRYLRFHGHVHVGPKLVEPALDPDWLERGALAGTIGAEGDERIVALGNYFRLRDPARAEVAFAVADELQGKGVGTRLLEQLAEEAGKAGVSRFLAEVLPGNRAMLRVFEEAGFELTRQYESGVAEVTLAIEPTAGYLDRVDRCDHVGVTASLAPFFSPASIAVVGLRRGAARSAASSSATSSPATSRDRR